MGKSTKTNSAAGYIVLFFLALGLRVLSNASHFFSPIDPGYRNFEINDSSYQIRRTEITLAQYPRVPFFDTYHYYPDNPAIPWPPGYNLFLATIAKPFEFFSTSRLLRETVIGLVPCVIDAITVILFLFFFSRFLPFWTAALSAFLLALSTQNVGYAEVGYIDHHYFISFLMAVFSVLLYAYHRNSSVKGGILLGGTLGLAPFFNVSMIQYVILALFVVIIHAFFDRESCHSWLAPLSVFVAALFSSLLSSLSTPTGRQGKLVYDETSFFQFGLILCGLLVFGFLVLWSKNQQKSADKKSNQAASLFSYSFRTRILGSVIFLMVFGVLVGLSYENILEGARFLLLGNRLNSVQGEEVSILTYGSLWAEIFTWFIFCLPFGVWDLWARRKKDLFFVSIVALFFLHGALSGAAHFLYVQYFYPWYAVVVALGLARMTTFFKGTVSPLRYLFALILIVQASYVSGMEVLNIKNGENQARASIKQTIQALAWLREHSPLTSFQDKGDGPPEYTVFAHRDYGHQIVRIAHRAVIVSPFSTTSFVEHMQDYVRATFSREEDRFVELMKKYNARYLILDQRDNTMKDFLLNVLKGEPDETLVRNSAESLVFLFRNNLLYFDGELRWKKTPSVKHFRLVYEVPARVEVPLKTPQGLVRHRFNGLKIFERVSGATIIGTGYKPGERVLLRLPLKTNSQREFVFSGFGLANEIGKIQITVPYSIEKIPGSAVVPLAEAYEIQRENGRKKKLIVSEQAATNGAVLSCPAF